MELTAGTRLRSQVGPTEVVVVRVPSGDVEITCGGYPMLTVGQVPQEGLVMDGSDTGSTQLGKRYSDPDGTIELLVTKPGPGSLAAGSVALQIKKAKPLPASD